MTNETCVFVCVCTQPAQVTYTLPLNNQAMKLLLDNAPNLKHLFLHSLWVTSDEFKDRLWQVGIA